MRNAVISSTVLVLSLACAAICAPPLAAEGPEEYHAFVVDTTGARISSSAHLTLHIDEYATPEEIGQHAALLAEKGPDGLEKVLWKLDRGWLRVGPNLGYPIAVARSFETGEGRTIRVMVDRPIQFFELRRSLRSVDYPFGLIELQLDADGKGEGTMIAAARIEFTKDGKLEIESLGVKPYKLLKVRPQVKKQKK